MSWSLRESPDALAAAAARVEQAAGIPMAHVEKDFWVTEVLRGVAQCSTEIGVSALFKGGTSLSKAFRLIQRFSEDVDIIVIAPSSSAKKNNRCLKSFVEAAEKATGIAATVDPKTVTEGVKRTELFAYPTESPPGAMRPEVKLELGTRGGALPSSEVQIRSLLAEHGPSANLKVDFVEAAPITLRVLAPVRTLVEKLMIVHHAASEGGPDDQARLARHYYDIWCLLNDVDTVAAFTESPADALAREVRVFTKEADLKTTQRPEVGFAASPAFDSASVEAAKSAFESTVIGQLVWPDAPRPSFGDCCEIVHEHAAVL